MDIRGKLLVIVKADILAIEEPLAFLNIKVLIAWCYRCNILQASPECRAILLVEYNL